MTARTLTSTPTGERGWRRVLRTVHLWTALILCAPLVVLGLTGSLLVFEHELEALVDPVPQRSLTGGTAQNVDAILAAARAAAPAGATPTMFLAPTGAAGAAIVRFAPRRGDAPAGAPGGISAQVFVDPVSLDVLGVREFGAGPVRQIFMLHANLLTRDRSGRAAIGWLGVAMLFLGCSGLVLWWPRASQWRGAFGVRRGARGLRLFRELHGAAGIWGLGVFLAVSASGTFLAFPQTISGAVATVLPARDLRATPTVSRSPDAGRPIAPDAAIAVAQAAAPNTVLRFVGFPARPDQPFRIALARAGDQPGQPFVTAFVDPYRARVLELRDPVDYSAGETVLAWQHSIHAGQGLGWLWRALVFLVGLLPSLFAISGIAMWLIKRRARRAMAVRRVTAGNPAE
ncbi:MAG: PepSY-associated TM helix domain-containing protein [Pseudomonadota bacterium]